MRLQTSLQLGAVFPVALPLALILLLRWRFGSLSGSNAFDGAFMAMVGLVGITMTAIITSYNRRIIDRIKMLNSWTESVLAGNLNHKADIPPGDDELTRLAQALERMLTDVKESYASLHHETASYKQRAEVHEQRATASQISTKHLTEALMRLKDSQARTLNEERLKALEQVVKGVAHDFSEALTPIMATTDLMLSRPELVDSREKLVEHVRAIRQSAEEGREVIRHLAGFFRHVPVTQDSVDINHAVCAASEQVESMWKSCVDKHGGRITLRTNLGIVPSVTGSEADIQDAIACLLINAYEAMPDGGSVSVTTRAEASAVVVEIGDTGKGMSDDVKQRAAEPFFSTKPPPHKGMGMTRAASTVRCHGGDIRVESEPGMGTRVSLAFPSREVPATAAQTMPPSGAPRHLNVIVVDDDRATREIIAFAASSSGHRVTVAANAEQCLEHMKQAPFDVAVVDLAMPGMRGDELATVVARTHPLTAVVMLTGFGDIMMEEKDIPDHVDILIPKPVSAKELLAVLEKAPRTHWENRQKNPKSSEADKEAPSQNEPSFKWQG